MKISISQLKKYLKILRVYNVAFYILLGASSIIIVGALVSHSYFPDLARRIGELTQSALFLSMFLPVLAIAFPFIFFILIIRPICPKCGGEMRPASNWNFWSFQISYRCNGCSFSIDTGKDLDLWMGR